MNAINVIAPYKRHEHVVLDDLRVVLPAPLRIAVFFSIHAANRTFRVRCSAPRSLLIPSNHR